MDGGGDLPVVLVNELMASNRTAHSDEQGEFDDWVELFNPGDDDVELGGWTLSDDPAEPGKYTFPAGSRIEAGGYLVVWTDSDPEQGLFHTSFKLAKEGEDLVLKDGDRTVDALAFGPQCTDVSFGRSPDGSATWGFLESPSPGAANGALLAAPPDCEEPPPDPDGGSDGGVEPATGVRINELSPLNETLLDEAGEAEPWVELFNAGATAVSLQGHSLTENPQVPLRWVFPDLELEPGGYLILFLDGEAAEGTHHASVALPATGGRLLLLAPDQSPLDDVSWGPLGPGESAGRFPDGEGALVLQTAPTPGATNAGPAPGPDGGSPDAGSQDGGPGPADGGSPPDAGASDAGPISPDGGAPSDAGPSDGGDA